MRLDEELEAAMRSSVAGTRLSPDVVAAARRAHRQRRTVRRGAFALGGLTLAAAVTGVVAVNVPGQTPAPPPAQVELQPASYVASHVSDAIGRSGSQIEYAAVRETVDGTTTELEEWTDGVTGDSRRSGPTWIFVLKHGDGTVTSTAVDHAARTWSTDTARPLPVESSGPETETVPRTAEEIRAALDKQSTLAVLGKEALDGRAVLHLRLSGDLAVPEAVGSYELWVDATTYDLVRVVASKRAPKTTATIQWDYDYLPRTPENLARFTLEPPSGYTRKTVDVTPKPGDGNG